MSTFKTEAKNDMNQDLVKAAADGDLEEFKRLEGLLKGEFDINWVDKYGYTFLMAGSTHGHLNVVTHSLMLNYASYSSSLALAPD